MDLNYLYDWLDFIWLPLALLIARKGQRIYCIMFVLMSIFVLRLQVELMQVLGFEHGFFKFLDYPALWRGYLAYGVFIALFLGLTRWSKEQDPYIFIAAGITIFVTAFCASTIFMVL